MVFGRGAVLLSMAGVSLRIVRLDHAAQLRPRDDLLHSGQERIGIGRAPVLPKHSAFISGYRKGLELHVLPKANGPDSVNLFSVAQGSSCSAGMRLNTSNARKLSRVTVINRNLWRL